MNARREVTKAMAFSILGIDSDNGAEFINAHLRNYCDDHQITFTRSRPGNKNDGAHVEGKNWTVVRRAVGYHRYDRAQTPYERVLGDARIDQEIKKRLYQQYESLNPAQIRREMNSLNDQILAITRAKRHKAKEAPVPKMLKRAKIYEATKPSKRAI